MKGSVLVCWSDRAVGLELWAEEARLLKGGPESVNRWPIYSWKPGFKQASLKQDKRLMEINRWNIGSD